MTTLPAAAPRWTPRRRLIAILLGLIWLFIGGVFAAAMLDATPTEVTYGSDTASVTLKTDKRIALAFLQCVRFSWSAQNIVLYKTNSLVGDKQPLTGDRQACSSQDARFAAEFDPEAITDTYTYPQTIWINFGALLFVGLAALVIAIFFWRPLWLGSLSANQYHLLFVPVFLIPVLMIQVIDPLEINLTTAPGMLAMLPFGFIGFGLLYFFRQQHRPLFIAACIGVLTISILMTAYQVFTIPGMLNYDERFYASIAATGASGLGLYPYMQNYPPMPIMGGVGGLAWLYVGAYNLFGPTIWGLRLVALLFYLGALPAIFILFRRWYGTATAWLAMALIPTTYFYTLSHSARMDSATLTWIWWGLLLVDTARRKQNWRWHLAAGLFFGLGLQAHIHTSITTIACGILYLVDYAVQVRRARRLVWPQAVIAYSMGALLGLGVFVVANILPNPDTFLRTAGSTARLSVVPTEETLSIPQRVLQSFFALETFVELTIKRGLYIFRNVPPVEIILGLIAGITLFIRRRSAADHTNIILLVGVFFAGFFILNGPSIYYTLHLLPVAMICLPSFFTHGYLRRGPLTVAWTHVTPTLLLVLLPLVFPLLLGFSVISPASITFDDIVAQRFRSQIDTIHNHVSPECILLGSGLLFQNSFMMYPRYNAYTLDETEQGRAYYGLDTYDELWPLLNPDIVFGDFVDDYGASVQRYIEANRYTEIAPLIWQKTHTALTPGCLIQTP